MDKKQILDHAYRVKVVAKKELHKIIKRNTDVDYLRKTLNSTVDSALEYYFQLFREDIEDEFAGGEKE
jgi:hypothetical protein